jgi:hypothetical protein
VARRRMMGLEAVVEEEEGLGRVVVWAQWVRERKRRRRRPFVVRDFFAVKGLCWIRMDVLFGCWILY